MFLVRLTLIATALLVAYIAVLPALVVPQLWLVYIFLLIVAACKKGHETLSSHGTARWAETSDLEGMIDEE